MNSNIAGMIAELKSYLSTARNAFADRNAWAEERDMVAALAILKDLKDGLEFPTETSIPETQDSARDSAKEAQDYGKMFLTLSSTPASSLGDLQWSFKKLSRALGEDPTDDGVKMALGTLTKVYRDSLAVYLKNKNPTPSVGALLQRVHDSLAMQNQKGTKLLKDAIRAYKLETD